MAIAVAPARRPKPKRHRSDVDWSKGGSRVRCDLWLDRAVMADVVAKAGAGKSRRDAVENALREYLSRSVRPDAT